MLLPGLPFVFVSQLNHVIAVSALGNNAPADIQLTKRYLKTHIEDIKNRFEDVKQLGGAAAEEWIKGLDYEGKERMDDAARWEKWESRGGLKKVNAKPHSKTSGSTDAALAKSRISTPNNLATPQRILDSRIADYPANSASTLSPHTLNTAMTSYGRFPQLRTFYISGQLTLIHDAGSTLPSHTGAGVLHDGLPPRPQGSTQISKHGRTLHDVNEAKALRRADIERRSMELGPPISASVLSHMDSFQAAIQISTPMTDNAWEVLKPRLLAQREHAEARENDRIEQGKVVQAKTEERRHQDAQLKEAKENMDKEWDTVQGPIRDRLATYADEIIQEIWAGGQGVTKDTCAKFAADVLIYVRKRFYDDVAQDDAAKRIAREPVNLDSANGPPSRKLILENMKWLFDNKIKSLTEHYQKELFLCNGCEGNFKFYGFEGVIQHYAAKHTTTLSLGSVVVHWRSEWPEHPPFHPNPTAAKTTYYAVPTPATTNLQIHLNGTAPPSGFDSFPPGVSSGPSMPQQGYGAQQYSPGLYPSILQSHNQDGPYAPTASHSQYQMPSGYQEHPQVQHAYPKTGQAPPAHSYGTGSHSGQGADFRAQHPEAYSSPHSGALYPTSYPAHSYPGGIQMQHSNGYPQVSPIHPAQQPLQPQQFASDAVRHGLSQGTDLYHLQMNDMAKHARDVWFSTSGIKDMPQSVRIFVVIHHVASRFAEKYTNEPSIAMFMDGLDHNAQMRPVRSLNGLVCRTCAEDYASGLHAHPKAEDKKSYTLPHLLNHFKNVHIEQAHTGVEQSKYDWKRDMVELPDTPTIANLINASGMNDAKLRLIAWVFPKVFPEPLPRVGSMRHNGQLSKSQRDLDTRPPMQVTNSHLHVDAGLVPLSGSDIDDRETFERLQATLRPLSRTATQASEPPGDDEYDPHRPAHLGIIVETHKPLISQSNGGNYHPISKDHHFQAVISQEVSSPGPMKREQPDYRDYSAAASHQFHQEETPHGFYKPETGQSSSSGSRDLSRAQIFNPAQHFPQGMSSHRPTPGRHSGLKYEYTDEPASEDGELVDGPALPLKPRDASPKDDSTAAEKFLSSFDPGQDGDNTGNRFSMDSDRDVYSPSRPGMKATTLRESHPTYEHNRQVHHVQRDNHLADRAFISPANEFRSGALRSNNGRYAEHTPVQASEESHRAERRAVPHAQPADLAMELENLASDQYSRRIISNPVGAHDPYLPQEIYEEPRRSKNNRNQGQHIVRYHGRSRSPQPFAGVGSTYYRSRSPNELSRQESIHRTRSPPYPMHVRDKRIINQDLPLPHDGYTYVRGPQLEERYQQGVEYFPAGGEEYSPLDSVDRGRYVVSQPQARGPPRHDHRFAQDFQGERVYEHKGQLYYAEPGQFVANSDRGITPVDYGYAKH